MSEADAGLVPALNTDPATWLDRGIEALYAMNWRDYEDVQLEVLRQRFAELKDGVAALGKLAQREGIVRIDSLADASPLMFDHRVYKNYPLSIIEKRDIPKLNAWLNRLTTHDLTQMDLSGLTTIEAWLDRLDDFGMLVGHSTGTTGKLSFVPRSRTELPAWERHYLEVFRATTGVDPVNDPVPSFSGGYRGGHHMALKMGRLFGPISAGGAENMHTLYQTHIPADLASLAGRMQAAEDRGELDKLGLDPALIEARNAMIAQARRRNQDMAEWFEKLFVEFRGKRVNIGGTAADLIRIARAGMERGIKPEFGAGSYLMSGGGMKGLKDPPENWERFVKDYFGIETLGMNYAMSECMSGAPRCSAGYFHLTPHLIPVLFDKDTKMLPREGVQTGRFGFFDLLAQTYWGGFISGDQVTIHWDEDCPCGWKGPRIAPQITRFADMEGGDDKITCAGTQKAYDEFLDFVSQG